MNIEKQATNVVLIEGTYLEADLREGKASNGKDYIAGNIIIGVDQKVNGKMEYSEIPVSVFATKLKNDGKDNPAFKNISKLKTDFVSKATAADTGHTADIIRLQRGEVMENVFTAPDGNVISFWRVRNAFFEQVKSDVVPKATFKNKIVLLNKKFEVDSEGVETGRLILKGALVQYAGKVDLITYVVETPDAIQHIDRKWQVNDTVLVAGFIRSTTTIEEHVEEVGFGAPIPDTVTRTKRELIVTTGSPEGLDESESYLVEDIKKGLQDRQERINEAAAQSKAKEQSADLQKGFGTAKGGF
jgi:hypothetical protein